MLPLVNAAVVAKHQLVGSQARVQSEREQYLATVTTQQHMKQYIHPIQESASAKIF
jgi:hypothetical protein